MAVIGKLCRRQRCGSIEEIVVNAYVPGSRFPPFSRALVSLRTEVWAPGSRFKTVLQGFYGNLDGDF